MNLLECSSNKRSSLSEFSENWWDFQLKIFLAFPKGNHWTMRKKRQYFSIVFSPVSQYVELMKWRQHFSTPTVPLSTEMLQFNWKYLKVEVCTVSIPQKYRFNWHYVESISSSWRSKPYAPIKLLIWHFLFSRVCNFVNSMHILN